MSSVGPTNFKVPQAESCGSIQLSSYKELVMVMVGKTGSGKSSTGNTIVGSKAFESSLSGSSVTKDCQAAYLSANGRTYQVLDTPGLKDNTQAEEDQARALIEGARKLHVLLYVVPIGRYTEDDHNVFRRLKTYLGAGVLRHAMFVFTCGDNLEAEEETIENYLATAPDFLREDLAEVQGMYIVLNNRASPLDKARQVGELLQKVEALAASNRGQMYETEVSRQPAAQVAPEIRRRVKQAEKKEMEGKECFVEQVQARQRAEDAAEARRRDAAREQARADRAIQEAAGEQARADRAIQQAALEQAIAARARREADSQRARADNVGHQLQCKTEELEKTKRVEKIAGFAAAGAVFGAFTGGAAVAPYLSLCAKGTFVSATVGGVVGGIGGGFIGTCVCS